MNDIATIKKVGTVELLTERIYPLDAVAVECRDRTTVVVEPGVYPVYRDIDAFYWMMTGRINGRGFKKIGDGMFEMRASDSAAGPEVTLPSARFGVDQFRKFLAEPTCTEGDGQQRLRFTLAEQAEG